MLPDPLRRKKREAYFTPDEETAFRAAMKDFALDPEVRDTIKLKITELQEEARALQEEDEAIRERLREITDPLALAILETDWHVHYAVLVAAKKAGTPPDMNMFKAAYRERFDAKREALKHKLTRYRGLLALNQTPGEGGQQRFDLPALKLVPFTALIPYAPKQMTQTRLSFVCPFHTEKTASFVVFSPSDTNHYHCFGCQKHGDTIKFVMDYHDLPFRDACKYLEGFV